MVYFPFFPWMYNFLYYFFLFYFKVGQGLKEESRVTILLYKPQAYFDLFECYPVHKHPYKFS